MVQCTVSTSVHHHAELSANLKLAGHINNGKGKKREYPHLQQAQNVEEAILKFKVIGWILGEVLEVISNYVHPTGWWTYYFCFSAVRGPTWFPDILGNSSYPIFTKFGMQVYWVNSLYGIAFGDDSCIAN